MNGRDESGSGGTIADRSLFQPFLEPGETILWVGRPGPIRFMAQGDRQRLLRALVTLIAVCSVLFLAIPVLFWLKRHQFPSVEFLVRATRAPIWLASICLAALVVLKAVVNSARVRRLQRSAYALTDRRALSFDRKTQAAPQLVELTTIDRFHHEARPDGSGFIVFGYRKEEVRRRGSLKTDTVEVPRLMFEDIGGVSLVRKLAEDAVEKQTLHPTPLSSEGR